MESEDRGKISWFAPVNWGDQEDWLRLGWMPSHHGGYHRIEYGCFLEYRCNCRPYTQPPTPKKDRR